jgi:type IV pilus assembly protein PilV
MLMKVSSMPSKHRQAGVSLIEVLVSALIVSIGLVGVAGLQVASLKNNNAALMRSQATALAYDLADRMRSNRAGAGSGFYDPDAAALTSGCGSTTGCTTQQLAQHDLAQWNAALATHLPAGQGFVCIDSTPNDGASAASPACDGSGTQFSIKIWWDEDADGQITVNSTNADGLLVTERLVINIQP